MKQANIFMFLGRSTNYTFAAIILLYFFRKTKKTSNKIFAFERQVIAVFFQKKNEFYYQFKLKETNVCLISLIFIYAVFNKNIYFMTHLIVLQLGCTNFNFIRCHVQKINLKKKEIFYF